MFTEITNIAVDTVVVVPESLACCGGGGGGFLDLPAVLLYLLLPTLPWLGLFFFIMFVFFQQRISARMKNIFAAIFVVATVLEIMRQLYQ